MCILIAAKKTITYNHWAYNHIPLPRDEERGGENREIQKKI